MLHNVLKIQDTNNFGKVGNGCYQYTTCKLNKTVFNEFKLS